MAELPDPIIFAPQLSTTLGGIPLGTIRYWDSTGYGPRSFKIGKRRAWRTSEVLRWLAEQEGNTGSGAVS
jgi:predicted DNA-binding transcriptional regulator AlpA